MLAPIIDDAHLMEVSGVELASVLEAPPNEAPRGNARYRAGSISRGLDIASATLTETSIAAAIAFATLDGMVPSVERIIRDQVLPYFSGQR